MFRYRLNASLVFIYWVSFRQPHAGRSPAWADEKGAAAWQRQDRRPSPTPAGIETPCDPRFELVSTQSFHVLKIRTSAVAFAKSSIPRPLARFALVSDTALRATIAENRLVSKAPPKPNIIAFSACDDRDDDDDVAATAFDDFLCETTRGICDDAHALVACANMMCDEYYAFFIY